jgi:putative phage-type endonuclease
VEQRSPEWFAIRRGAVTASRIADVTARTKTGHGASRANYMAELIVERLTGQTAPSYENDAMRWGSEQEAPARLTYQFMFDVQVEPIGFAPHPSIANAGASPDGAVGDRGLVEIKAPNTATHLDTLLTGVIADKYFKQMQFQMACTGRHFCDFVSFDPRLPPSMQLWVKRVDRDETLIGDLEREVREFLAELDHKVDELKRLYDNWQTAA